MRDVRSAYVTAMRVDCADDAVLRKWISRVMKHLTARFGPGIAARDCEWSVKQSNYGNAWIEIHAVVS